jgi:phosphohistidine phosphatase
MLIVLFRHGPAGSADPSRWPDDSLRPLTSKGEDRTRAAAMGIRKLLGESIDVVLTSPLLRAEQTAKILASETGCKRQETLDALAPGGSFRRTLAALEPYRDAAIVALVGHEPDLGKLAGVLVFGAPSALPLKKAGACAIECADAPQAGGGSVLWLLPPRLLRRLGGKKARGLSGKKARA